MAPSIPLLGSLPWLARNATDFIERVMREKGPVVRIPFGVVGLVLITDPADVQRVLKDANRNYIRGTVVDLIRPMLGNGLPLSDPPFWLRQRRIMQPSFARTRIAKMADVMNRISARNLDRLSNGQELLTHDLMLYIARETIVETMFSEQLESDLVDIDRALTEIDRYVQRYMLLPFAVPLWLPLPDNLRFRSAIKVFDKVVYGIIDKRHQGGQRRGDLLDALIDGRDEESGERMSRQELRDEVINIFFAGHETTATALSWLTLVLTQHEVVWERVRSEVDAILMGRPPTYEDLSKLVYTNSVIRETLRLYPPAWMFARVSLADDALGGYAIPRGTAVMLSPFAMHRNPQYWPNPHRFDPDRFSHDPSLGLGAGKNWAYLPFGGGPHMCIGNHFAMLEITIVLAQLVQRGRLRALRPQAARLRIGNTLRISDHLPARFEARNST